MIIRLLVAVAMVSLAIYIVMPRQSRLVKITAEDEIIHGGDHGARGNFKTVSEADRAAGFTARPFSYAAIGAVLLNLLRFLGASLGLTARPRQYSRRSSAATRGDSGICTAEGSLMDDGTSESMGSQELVRNGEQVDANELQPDSNAGDADDLQAPSRQT